MAPTLCAKPTQPEPASGATVCSETEYSGLKAADSRLLQGVFWIHMVTRLSKRKSRQATLAVLGTR
jgi:hypothetical protein